MHRLRTARHIARFVLVWFALAIGAAVASPLIKPQTTQLICTGSGVMQVLVANGDGGEPPVGHNLDCPLCATVGTPPPADRLTAEPCQPLSYAPHPVAAARIAGLTAAPPPARGPPQS